MVWELSTGRRDAEPFHAPIESISTEGELFGDPADIPMHLFELTQECIALSNRQGIEIGFRCVWKFIVIDNITDFLRQIVDCHQVVFTQCRAGAKHIPQLANIARPGEVFEQFQGFGFPGQFRRGA